MNGFLDGHIADLILLVADHAAKAARGDEFDGFGTEAHAEDAIERRGGTTALEMAEGAGAGFLAGVFFDLLGHVVTDATEAVFAFGADTFLGEEFAGFNACAFGDDDEGAVTAGGVAFANGLGDVLEVEGDFWQQDHICPTSHAAIKGDPACMASHDFQHDDALVAFCGGVQAIQGIHDGGDGGIKTKGGGGGLNVIVDGLGDADDVDAHLGQLQAGGEAAISTDHDQRTDFEVAKGVLGFIDDFNRHLGHIAFADFGNEVAFVGGAEDGAAELHDADGLFRIEHHVIARRQQTFEAIAEANDLPAESLGGTDDAVDDRIESGAIPAAV